MANPEKSAPEALREAVGELLAILDDGGVVLIDDAYDREAVKALRAAHERPGAYGPHPDDLPNTAREVVQWVSDTVGLSVENEAIFATKLGSLVASECVSASQEVAKERDDLRAQLEVARSAETAHEAAREALAEAGVECETVAEGIRLLFRRYTEVAQAVGIVYEANGHDAHPGPHGEVVAYAEKNRDQAGIADEWEQRAHKLDEDVDHFHRKWKAAEERARKAEAAGGVGLLRRLRAWGASLRYAYEFRDEIDRLIAEAEAQPAEESTESLDLPEAQPQRGPHVHYTVEPGKRENPAEKVVTVYGGDGVRVVLGDEPKREPQEGDEVPTAETDREWLSAIMTAACESDVLPTDWLAPILKVLQRRREGAKSWPDGRALR